MIRTIIFTLALCTIVYNSVETGRSLERCNQQAEQMHNGYAKIELAINTIENSMH